MANLTTWQSKLLELTGICFVQIYLFLQLHGQKKLLYTAICPLSINGLGLKNAQDCRCYISRQCQVFLYVKGPFTKFAVTNKTNSTVFISESKKVWEWMTKLSLAEPHF